MNFHCMKRKQLQALCKKHKIPANLSNLDMANKLTELLKEKETPVIHVVMKEQDENVNEAESNNVIVNREVKKVRFSPEHELIEFTRVQEVKRRSRRNSICRTASNWSVESGEVNKETVGRWGRTTRTGELKIMEEQINQKKRGVKAVTCNNDGKAIVENDKMEEGDVVEPGRVTRSRRKMEVQGVKNTSTKKKKGAKDDNKRVEKASDDINNEKHEEIVDNHSRVSRSRAQKLTEAPAEVGKRGRRVVRNIGKVAAVRAEAVDNGESGAESLSKRGDEGEGTAAAVSDERMHENGEGLKENLVNKQIAGEHVTVELPVLLRRSKRKVNMVGDSENGGIKKPIKTSKFLASDCSQVVAVVTGSEVNEGRRAVLKIEEPIKKVEPRRSNRRKTVVESDDLKAETENRYPLRTSVPPSDIVPEVSKDDKVVLQPIGVMRRCRSKTLSLKLDSANDTDSAVENRKAEKHVSDEKENSAVQSNTISRSTTKCKPYKIDGDSNVVQNNKVVKRKRGNVSEGDALKKNNDHNSGAQSLKGSSSKKVVSAVATGNFADEGKQPLLLDSPNMLDASLHSSLEIGESLFLDVQLPVSKDSESASNFCTKDIISDAELTSTRNTCRKKENLSIAASKIAQLEIDSTISEDQNCTSNIREVEKGDSLLELEAQQSTEKNITDVDKNHETQVYSRMEDSACKNKINDQVLADGLYFSDETRSSAGSLVKTDLKVAEIEADERLQSCNRVVDHHTDLEHLEATKNILDNNEDASQTAGEIVTFVSYETDYTHSTGTLKLKVPSSSLTRHHGDNVAEGNETLLHKGVEELAEAEDDGCSKECGHASSHISEFDMLDNGETCDGESSKGHMSKCDEDGEFSLANLFDAEGIYGITPQDTEKFSGETLEGESSKGHISKCDENGEFSLVSIFDAERRFGITPQDREKFSGDDEQGMLHGSTSVAPITMCNNSGDHEENLLAEGGKTCDYKDKPSELTAADESGSLESQKSSKDDWEFSVSNLLDGEKSTRIELQDLPAVSTVCVNYNEVKSGRDSSNSQETTSTPSSVSENQDKEDSAGACISDIKNYLISKIAAESLSDMTFQDSVETEQQHKNLQSRLTELNAGEEATHATQRKSWTEIELHNLFGSTSDEDASPGQDDTFCLESEIEILTMSKNKSTSGSLTKQKGKEMEGDSRNECPKTKYKDVVLPTGFNADIYENELKSLFATPVKIMTTSKTEKTYSHDRTLDSSVTSIKGCSETRKENVASESMSDGKAENSGYGVENNLCVGASLSGNDKDDICGEINEVESVLLLNKSTGVLSGAEYDGCEGLEDQLAQNKEECMKDTNLVTGKDNEEHVIPLAQSCLHDEALEKNIIISSCSPWDLYEPESCAHMSETLSCHSKAPNKSEGEMVQNTEAVVESSDTDLQKSEVPENDYLLTAGSDDGNDLRETLVETSSDPEEAKTGSFQIDVSDKEHESYVFGAVSGLLSSSAMPSHLGYHENGDMNLEAEKLSDNGGDDTCEKINKFDSVLLEEYDGCEASEEQLTENTEECEKETNFMTEVGEENVKNSRIYQESEQEMAQSSEAALELSDADISKNSHPTGCFDDDNISEEASLDTVSGPLVAELANIDCQSIDKGTSLHHSSKVSHVYDDLTQRKDTDDLNGAKICDEIDATANSSKDMSDELPINSEVEILKTLQDSDNLCEEADKLPCSAGLESASLEAKEMDNTTQDPNTIVAPAEHGSSVCGDVSSILSSSEMHLHLRDDNNDNKSLDVVGTPVFNLSRDNDKKNSEKAEENSTTQVVEFPIQELHFEENVEDFKNDTHTISDLPASGYNEMLKESDVADTIKEYIDSESSLSVIFENSIASLSSDMLAHTDDMIDCENSALSKHEGDNAGRLAISKDEDKTVDCLETEIKEQDEAALFVEPAQVSGNAVNSAGCVGLFTEGSAVKLDAQKKVETGQRSSSNESCSIMRKNARTILIHGTPNKLLTMADMKENAPTQKSSNIGDITAVRPAKRRALQDIQRK